MKAPQKAIAGAASAGIATSWTRPCHSTPASPDCAIAAPTRPPISACDELDGRPSHHVIRFQAIAPISAASTVFSLARPVSMIPLPTVFATAVVTKAPARFATAAIKTALRGESALVETEVATAFAVSWKPFVKSKPSATATTITSRTVSTDLLVLDDDRLEDVGGVLERVDGFLEPFVDVLPADDHLRVVRGGEELRDRVALELVAFVLELPQRRELLGRVAEAVEPPNGLVERGRGPQDHVRLVARLLRHALDAPRAEVVGSLVDVIADVVDRAREPVHVVAVEGGDERAVQQVHDIVR